MKFVNACSFLAGMFVLGVGAAPSQAVVDSAFAWMTNYERIPRNFEVLILQALLEQMD